MVAIGLQHPVSEPVAWRKAMEPSGLEFLSRRDYSWVWLLLYVDEAGSLVWPDNHGWSLERFCPALLLRLPDLCDHLLLHLLTWVVFTSAAGS